MKVLFYAAITVAAFVALSLVSFWLAIRPPRLSTPLRPADFMLAVEELSIPTADGLRLSAWLVPRAVTWRERPARVT